MNNESRVAGLSWIEISFTVSVSSRSSVESRRTLVD